MKLSLKAHRFVAEAIRDLPDPVDRDRLRSWMRRPAGENLPPEIAVLTLAALERFEIWMKECLEAAPTDEDRQADLVNDIRFVQAIESELRKEGVRTVATY
jgi:hypothetical protein